MSAIHPLAYVDRRAELGREVQVGPFAYVGPDVRVGDGCVLHPRATLLGPSEIGPSNVFFPGCVIGAPPQDLKYKGGPTKVVIGANNQFREQVTIHRGTEVDQRSGGVTRIGDQNLLMVGVHLAHDAEVRNHVILANGVLIAGHVCIEDFVNVGGGSAMHHFVTLGRYAYIGGMTRITHDAPPYMKVQGYDGAVRGVNAEGMRRWRLPEPSIVAVKNAFRLLYARRTANAPGRTVAALREIESDGLMADEHVRYLVEFLHRKLMHGVYGRARERARTDVPQDRAHFYQAQRVEQIT